MSHHADSALARLRSLLPLPERQASLALPLRKLHQAFLHALVERVHTMLKPEAERSGVALEVALAADVPKIRVDPELLYRALTNLVLNAIQVQRNGGRVTLATSHDPPGEVGLHVVDTGPGISPEDLEHIFDPFFSRRAGGTGLGLSIVHRIVTAHGGRIDVTSRPERTEFVLRFPEEPV